MMRMKLKDSQSCQLFPDLHGLFTRTYVLIRSTYLFMYNVLDMTFIIAPPRAFESWPGPDPSSFEP